MLKRVHYFNKKLQDHDDGVGPPPKVGYGKAVVNEELEEVSPEDANLVSSRIGGDLYHAPAIDIDGIPCRLYESKTPGHYHLLIDKPMSWPKYRLLLWALYKVGIIEENYYEISKKRGATFLRTVTHTEEKEVTQKKHPSMTWQ